MPPPNGIHSYVPGLRPCQRSGPEGERVAGRGPRGGGASRMLIATGLSAAHVVVAELPRHRHPAADDRDHRARAHRLADHAPRPPRRRSSSPSGPPRAGARRRSGARTSRSQAHASELAVVSWPASTSVSSSSRSSRSVSASPSSVRACSSSERMSRRSSRSAASRRRARSPRRSAGRAASSAALVAPDGLVAADVHELAELGRPARGRGGDQALHGLAQRSAPACRARAGPRSRRSRT